MCRCTWSSSWRIPATRSRCLRAWFRRALGRRRASPVTALVPRSRRQSAAWTPPPGAGQVWAACEALAGRGHPLPAARPAGLAAGSNPDPGRPACRRSQPPRSRLRRRRALSRPIDGPRSPVRPPPAISPARGRVVTDSRFSLCRAALSRPPGPRTAEQPAELAILMAMTAAEQMSLADVKNRLSEVVDRVQREHGRLVITKHGHPAAVVMSVKRTWSPWKRPWMSWTARHSWPIYARH